MATKLKISFTSMNVSNNGEASGKGELFWQWLVDGNIVGQRLIGNPLKVADGETIQLSASTIVSKSPGESLTIEGSLSEKDDLSKDEHDDFKKVHTNADNWGVGNYTQSLRDRKLDVALHYKIERV